MTESPDQQVAKVVDDAIARRDPTLPRWAAARITRVLRELDVDDRRAVVDRVCERPNLPASLAADVRAAAEKAAAPAPTPVAPPMNTADAPPVRRRPRQAGPPKTAVRTRTVIGATGRTLANVPAGTGVQYQGRHGVIEPPWLVLEDGRRFEYLKPAAIYVNGGVEVDGWEAWKVSDGRSLAQCYDSGSWPPPD